MDGVPDLGRIIVERESIMYPDCSMRDHILKEKHSGVLVGHFGHDKTYAQLMSSYY
jgi:hypothetical protein